MMAVETGQAIRAAIWTRLTTDATLKTLFGISSVVSLYRIMAPPDPAFPYMVDRLQMNRYSFTGPHRYLLDFWDFDEDASPVTVDAAVDRVYQLLHEWTFETGDSEGHGFIEASPVGWGYIPTDSDVVLHYATEWTVTFGAARDIENIVG